MAYKFQLGTATLSGSVTFKEGLDANEANISNVGDVAIDSLSADNNDMDFTLTDDRSAALEIKSATDTFLTFKTTDASERIEAGQHLRLAANKKLQLGGGSSDQLEVDTDLKMNAAADIQLIPAGGDVKVTGNLSSSANLAIGGTVHLAGVAIAAHTLANDRMLFIDADDGLVKKQGLADYATAIAGSGIAASSGVLSVDIDELTALGGASLHQTQDHFIFSDNGNEKKITFNNLCDSLYADISGDAAIAAGGALTIAAGAVEGSMLNDNCISGQGALAGASMDQADLLLIDDGPGEMKKITFSNFEDSIFANISGDAAVAAGGALTLAANSVSQAQLDDDAVGADELAADAVVNASVAAGAAIAASKLDFNVDLGSGITFGSQSDDIVSFTGGVTVGGNLIVNGTTTTVNSTTINISSSFTFEGPADAHETTLHAGSPSQDITIYLPQYSSSAGAHSAYIPVLAGAPTAASALVTAAEFALLDGASSVATVTVADGDGVMFNDAGTMKQITVQSLAAYFDDEITAMPNLVTVGTIGSGTWQGTAIAHTYIADDIVSGQTELAPGGVADEDELMISDGGVIKRIGVDSFAAYVNAVVVQADLDDVGTLVAGFNNWGAPLAGAESATLPGSPAVGDVVYVKAPSNCSSTYTVTINKAGSQTIDGEASIILESPYAAVSLCYVESNIWSIF
tara:strand:+ start:83 stop:2149 length:2067 start_codon:yes stop_codon:yes gene_type:complete